MSTSTVLDKFTNYLLYVGDLKTFFVEGRSQRIRVIFAVSEIFSSDPDPNCAHEMKIKTNA